MVPNDDKIQRCLLAEKDLAFDKALEIAKSIDVAAKCDVDLQKQVWEASV